MSGEKKFVGNMMCLLSFVGYLIFFSKMHCRSYDVVKILHFSRQSVMEPL